jgi:hypothetical protein
MAARRRRAVGNGHFIESFERRTLLAVNVSIDASNIANLTTNGFGGEAVVVGSRLRMTSGQQDQSRSVFTNDVVPIHTFRADFSYRSNPGDSADGLCFVVQNGPATALGTAGLNLGYTGIANSEAACLNLYNFTSYGSQFGFASDGQVPPTNTDMSPIDLHNGNIFKGTISYDGTTLSAFVRDAAGTQVFQASKTIDLPAAIGSSTARVGFTAATGVQVSTQYILSCAFNGVSKSPTVATPASATPGQVSGSTTALSVLGAADEGESGLTYTWSLQKQPGGAKTPTFSANGTNAAKSVNATFFKAGFYRFRCTIENAFGERTISDVEVTVDQVLTSVRMTPHAQTVRSGATIDYNATAHDQFGHRMRSNPAPVFALTEGSGQIDSATGIFTAGNKGHAVISATIDELSGTVGATVTA